MRHHKGPVRHAWVGEDGGSNCVGGWEGFGLDGVVYIRRRIPGLEGTRGARILLTTELG